MPQRTGILNLRSVPALAGTPVFTAPVAALFFEYGRKDHRSPCSEIDLPGGSALRVERVARAVRMRGQPAESFEPVRNCRVPTRRSQQAVGWLRWPCAQRTEIFHCRVEFNH